MSSNKQLFVYSLSSCGQITKTMKEEKAAKLTFASSGDRTSPMLCITYVKKNTNFVENKSSKNIIKIINLYKISAGDEPIPFLVENSKSLPYLCSYLNIWLMYISLNPFPNILIQSIHGFSPKYVFI